VTWLPDETVRRLRRVAEWPDLAETKYRLEEELGSGGMGTVYLAEDTVLGRKVALKVVSTAVAAPETAERMLREARVVARLEHPGIVPVHDAGALPDGRVFYAMKRVDGERLDALAPRLPLTERLRIFQKICDAVAFAHAHGVVHRDLKPENVMVGAFGEVLVMDWGVAKLLHPGGGDALPTPGGAVSPTAADTAAGTVVGTPGYMAPEQARGASDRVGPWSDVYALGGVLRFLLTLRAHGEGGAAPGRAAGRPHATLEARPRAPSPPWRPGPSPRLPGNATPARKTSRPRSPGTWRAAGSSPTGRAWPSAPDGSSRATGPPSSSSWRTCSPAAS
jgi:serine/threonine protein kinase